MTLLLTDRDVARAVNMPSIIAEIERGVIEEGQNLVEMPPRMNLSTAENGWFRLMPAVMNGSKLMGLKFFFRSTENSGVRYLIGVIDQKKNELVALLDGHLLTAIRTGATTGVATKYLARENASTVGLIGSGLEGRTNFEAVCAVRNIKYAKVYSPNAERRQLFAREMSAKLGISIDAVDSPEEAVKDVDIVNVATNTASRGNIIAFKGQWMREGVHVNAIGSTMPSLREIDADTFDRADLIVVDTKHLESESGDVMDAIAQGKYNRSKVVEMKEIVGGTFTRTDKQITLFKSVGTAIQDVMSGYAIYLEAEKLGIGVDVRGLLGTKVFN
jgi:ornithine cyclodeaminase/alanine dehydrogenase-like protein (mu-crystallin family)